MGKLFFVVFISASIAFVGCVYEPDTAELIKHMFVRTRYNTDYINSSDTVFKTYNTFVIRQDTMGFVSTQSSATYITEEDVPNFVEPVVDEIRTRFINAGFNQVTVNDAPDFSVNVVVLHNFEYYQSINYGYGYPGSYYYGYYGYYYPVVSTYYANYVTLLIQVVDAKNLVDNEYPIIWSAYIGDLNATMDLTGKTLEAVATAFDQSPYIEKP